MTTARSAPPGGDAPPSAARADVTRARDGMEVLDLARYPPFLLNAVSGAWIRATSAVYRRDFGFGIGEWRVLAMIAVEPEIRQRRICDALRMNKSAVSRCLAQLHGMALLEDCSDEGDRRPLWRLSAEGARVHGEVLAVALDWERRMMRDVPPQKVETFLEVMQTMLDNLEREEEG